MAVPYRSPSWWAVWSVSNQTTDMKRPYTVLTEAGTTADVAAALADKSVDVNQVLEQINVITVNATSDEIATIQALPAVVTVEPDREIRIG